MIQPLVNAMKPDFFRYLFRNLSGYFSRSVRPSARAVLLGIVLCLLLIFYSEQFRFLNRSATSSNADSGNDYIKWVDFQVTSEAMNDAYQYDLKAHDTDTPLDWVSLLAVLGVKYGGDFKNYKKEDLEQIVNKILNKESTFEQLVSGMKHYDYYNEAYHAVLGGFVGTYQVQIGRAHV